MERHRTARRNGLRPHRYRPPGRLHLREQSRPRDNRPANGTYSALVETPVDPAVARARFAAWVDRALRQAQDNGLSYRKIQEISGVATSTVHRWQTQQAKTLPTLDKVRAFAAATGAS